MPHKSKEERKAYNAAYYASHREELQTYQREYRRANLEEVREHHKAYDQAHKEHIASYQKQYRETHREQWAAYREARRERVKQYGEEYKERVAAQTARYYQEHRAEAFAKAARRRALKRGVTIGDAEAIKDVYRRARENKKVRCYLCGKLIPIGSRNVDHIVPLAKGGAHTASNLAIAHERCNKSKNDKHPNEIGLLI